MKADPAIELLENAIAQAVKLDPSTDIEGDSFLSTWIVVSEWVDADGHRRLVRHYSEGQSEWERAGMLGHAGDEEMWIDDDD